MREQAFQVEEQPVRTYGGRGVVGVPGKERTVIATVD